MDLLTLNLQKALEWTVQGSGTDGIRSFDEALSAIEASDEGDEMALFWNWDSVIDASGDDGPHAKQPIPLPLRVARSTTKPGATPAANPSAATIQLETGRYLFTQARKPAQETDGLTADAWLGERLEWFAREAWWTQATGTGELIVRLVHEDGKVAVQSIRARADITTSE